MLRPSGGFLKKIFGPRGSNKEDKGGTVGNVLTKKKPAEQPMMSRVMSRGKDRMMNRMMSRRSEREA